MLRYFKHRNQEDQQLKQFLYSHFAFKPGNYLLYHQAFQHKSALRDDESAHEKSNERLEFLGDTILDAIVAEHLFQLYPKETEGFLTKLKSKVVKRETLNFLGDKLELDKMVKHTQYGINNPKSLLGNALEALIGAIFLDKGYAFTSRVVVDKMLKPYLDLNELASLESDYKSRIIIWSQREKRKLDFHLLKEENKGTQMLYEVEVLIDNTSYSSAKAATKKEAEQEAARMAWAKIND